MKEKNNLSFVLGFGEPVHLSCVTLGWELTFVKYKDQPPMKFMWSSVGQNLRVLCARIFLQVFCKWPIPKSPAYFPETKL
ncbi:hypothetical protein AYI68_g2814 [Smittium mucronatum]|uniref:Uncharacterized protein n=1 Tax=Smittium mucronatum TaxID=133383 RepID=A0A1R0H1P0_9FUNG|nr:hypothetical protein AYI68_g2814 [Smittium mucronatum]